MKQINTLVSILLIACFAVNAQTTEEVVISGLENVTGLVLNGNDLYIADNFANKISKIDITAPLPTTPTTVITGVVGVFAIALNGNDLYMSLPDKISKIDITDQQPTLTDVVIGLENVTGFAFNGNDLYMAVHNANKISKIDITAPLPTTATDVAILNDEPTNLLLHNNDLYISKFSTGISKIDITTTSPTEIVVIDGGFTTGLDLPFGMAIYGNDLYVADNDHGNINKLDITATLPTTMEMFVTGIYPEPGPLVLYGSDLYFGQYNKISKVSIAPLSVDENVLISGVQLYPNPVNNHIQLYNLTEIKNYTIYDLLGKEISNGIISNNQKIDVEDYSKGLYFLKLQNGNTFKFLKE